MVRHSEAVVWLQYEDQRLKYTLYIQKVQPQENYEMFQVEYS